MILSDIEEYSLRSIAVLGGNMHSQITVENLTLLKAVLSTVKIFAVYNIVLKQKNKSSFHSYLLMKVSTKTNKVFTNSIIYLPLLGNEWLNISSKSRLYDLAYKDIKPYTSHLFSKIENLLYQDMQERGKV